VSVNEFVHVRYRLLDRHVEVHNGESNGAKSSRRRTHEFTRVQEDVTRVSIYSISSHRTDSKDVTIKKRTIKQQPTSCTVVKLAVQCHDKRSWFNVESDDTSKG
jgi:hypothetical protein